MNKQEFLTKVQGKVGFKSIIADEQASDTPPITDTNKIEKRFLKVATLNADGTAGITFVFYLEDTVTHEVWFYNTEPEAIDTKEAGADQKKLAALETYLKATFDGHFVIRMDYANNFAEAETFKANAGKLDRKKVLVFKKGTNPITHLEIVG